MLLINGQRGQPVFPAPEAMAPDAYGQVALGGDLHPATLLEAYRKGVFPWDGRPPIPWFSPDPRLILAPEDFVAHRSLRKAARRGGFDVTLDQAFEQVMVACGAQPRGGQLGTWITPRLIKAYVRLHHLGVAHSVEVWQRGHLVGGVYGLSLGRGFFGESMFAARPNASKIGLWRLCQGLAQAGYHFVDCQQDTPHLRSLGARLVPRADYLARLATALAAGEGWGAAKAALAAPSRGRPGGGVAAEPGGA